MDLSKFIYLVILVKNKILRMLNSGTLTSGVGFSQTDAVKQGGQIQNISEIIKSVRADISRIKNTME